MHKAKYPLQYKILSYNQRSNMINSDKLSGWVWKLNSRLRYNVFRPK